MDKSFVVLDIEQLVLYGKTVSYLSRLTDELDNLVASRNKCVELIKNSKSQIKINNVFIFDKVSVNGYVIDTDKKEEL